MKTIKLTLLGITTLGLTAAFAASTPDTMKKQPVLKSISCPPECGFMARSHDEKELIQIVKSHAKQIHGKDIPDAQLKEMVKTEKPKKR